MNVPFFLPDTQLEATFLASAKARGLHQLKGHKSVGGMRASIYNAMPLEGVLALSITSNRSNTSMDKELQIKLEPLREKIDRIDHDILGLINERAKTAQAVGDLKHEHHGSRAGVPSRARIAGDSHPTTRKPRASHRRWCPSDLVSDHFSLPRVRARHQRGVFGPRRFFLRASGL